MSYDVTLAAADPLITPPGAPTEIAVAARPPCADGTTESLHDADAVVVEVASAARLAELSSDWRDLLERSDLPNVFMNPDLVRLAQACYPRRRYCTLLAWRRLDGHRRLVGVWAFAINRAPRSIIPAPLLIAPLSEHAYLATPVIDRDFLDTTLDAMLQCVADDETLPKIVALEAMIAEGATMQALLRVLAARGSRACMLGSSVRPKLASSLDSKQYLENALSASTRKKLRQHRRRLAQKGVLASNVMIEPAAIRPAIEDFLQIEASGWKGKQGTALLSSPEDAAFTRAMVAALATNGDASIHALYLDGHPVSMQIVLRAGAAAFTWKTSYDEALHDVSPGMLLLEDYTAAFLNDASVAYVDSCAYDDSSYMAAWTERQKIASLWFDARRGASWRFAVLSRLQKAYLALRAAAKSAYHARPWK